MRDVPMAVAAIKAGAEDFIEKPVDDAQLLAAINRCLARAFDKLVREQSLEELRGRLERLTPRETEVMDLVVDGFTSQAIAPASGHQPAHGRELPRRRSWTRCRPKASPCWCGRPSASAGSLRKTTTRSMRIPGPGRRS